jgi:hypothetical protein
VIIKMRHFKHALRKWHATTWLAAGLIAALGGLAATRMAQAQTPPQGMDEATGMDYSCEGTLGYVGCENLMHPGPHAPAPPPKPDVWGALAVAPATLLWGTSWNYKTKQAAQAEALRRCRLSPAAKDCKIAVTVADVCVALVVSKPEKIYKVGGPTGAANFAEDNGKLQCQRAGGRSCATETSFCADGVQHVLNGQTVFSNGNPIFVPAGSDGAAGFGRRR